ncbi:MAG: M13 family metallopeptidase [Acidobacteriota bacterium]|nr:M13 family metallopeptidase [Acidobacteriota bacterium]
MKARFGLAVLFSIAGNVFAQELVSKRQPGFSPANMDRAADPCVNFYQYACGTWLKDNPVPPDQSRWGSFDVLNERNQQVLRGILEKAAADDPKRAPIDQKIGDFYAGCMDETAINKQALEPLKPELDRIATISAKNALLSELVRLHRIGVNVFFNFSSGPDFKNSKLNIAQASQGGLGLPDREYYLNTDAKSVELRNQYQTHVQKMLQLLGESPEKSAADGKAVVAIETNLAKGSLDKISRRDPQKVYHKLTEHELFSLSPFLDWNKYFAGMGAPLLASLNVEYPNFFRQLESTIVQTSLDDLKTYLRWHLIHAEAALLPAAFVYEDFDFYGKRLTGAKELRPRWKRCVEYTDNDLGEALGQRYVDQTFGTEGKKRTLKMVEEIEKALANDLETLSWMTPATKKEAMVKLQAVTNKIGFPDKWRDYSTLRIVRGDAVGNDQRATEFEVQRQLHKIGQPVDPKEWGMTPPTVNAYYNPLENNINFPAGILQPPFYDNKLDDAPNYGGIGAVVGHELTHGFDDQGRQFDATGNLRDWWTPQDAQEFEKRADCFIKEYASFSPVPGVHLNGKLTLGENTADNGGMRLAFMALMDSLRGKSNQKIDGFTPLQRFFLGWGQIWCENTREESARLRATVNPHSPGEFRVNGVVSNMPEFRQAFACNIGQPMVREPVCRVW